MKRLNKLQIYNRVNALFAQAQLTTCIEVLITLLHNCARQVPVYEIQLAKTLVTLLEPIVAHLKGIADQTPPADVGVANVDPALVNEASGRG